MRTLVVANQKGGTAKTTTAIHVAWFAADAGQRVLMVDLDEGDVAAALADGADLSKSLQASALFAPIDSGLLPAGLATRLDLIPADAGLLDVDEQPLDVVARPRERLARFASDYDLVVVDTPPNLQRRMLGALTAGDAVIVPMQLDTFVFGRIKKLESTIRNVQRRLNPALRHIGYLPSIVNSKSPRALEVLSDLQSAWQDRILSTSVNSRTSIPQSLAFGQPVWKGKDGNSRVAAVEMRAACEEILRRLTESARS